ncbi:sugar ABC transporter permease [Natronospirillum operosum]|uniref:Sugar ABC transporter permease n=1 Tax=Natronospirillum operosum TaxID=2759953 RepID=A0A4Z0W839_9GAMM|nr:sugar ABC transporter permease [Natronospirillum operosum]TGG94234.1 sugar ABC transporter permease [Natronospirillum operosum]
MTRSLSTTPADTTKGRRRMSYAIRERLERTLLLVPGVVLYGLFNFIPLLGLLYLSQVRWRGIGEMHYVGLDNFRQVLLNPYFRDQLFNAFFQNVIFFFVVIGSFLIIGTGLALLLSFRTWGRKTYQTLFFLPYPLAAAAVAFLLDLFVNTRGPLNAALTGLGITEAPIPFLGSEDTALVTLALFYSWHRMGFAIMLVLSAILAVRNDLLEAAILDGANRLQAIRHIVMPVLAPAFVLITVIIMVDVFNNADYTLLIMGPEAGPLRSTDVMGTYLFRTAFGGSAASVNTNFGMAAAIGLLTAIMIMPAAIILALRNLRRD